MGLEFLVVQVFLAFQENQVPPLSHYNPALLLGQARRPVLADLEVLEFLEIQVIQVGLLFLLDQMVPEVRHSPSLLEVRLVPRVQETLGPLAVR